MRLLSKLQWMSFIFSFFNFFSFFIYFFSVFFFNFKKRVKSIVLNSIKFKVFILKNLFTHLCSYFRILWTKILNPPLVIPFDKIDKLKKEVKLQNIWQVIGMQKIFCLKNTLENDVFTLIKIVLVKTLGDSSHFVLILMDKWP